MKETMNMYIKTKDFTNLLSSYLSNEEGQNVTVKYKCNSYLEGFYEEKVTKVELFYEKCVKINGYDTTITVTLDDNDIKSILSKVISDYEIMKVRFETCMDDRYNTFVSLYGVYIDIKPKQMKLSL